MVRKGTPGNKGGPADRWRGNGSFAERARQSAQTKTPVSDMLPEPSAPAPVVDVPAPAVPQEEAYVYVRLPRSFLSFLNPEYVMNNATPAATTTAAPKTADTLRAEIAHHEQQQAAAREQLAQIESTAPIAAVAAQSGKRNLAKTVGKVAGVVGVTGLVIVGGVYLYRYFRPA